MYNTLARMHAHAEVRLLDHQERTIAHHYFLFHPTIFLQTPAAFLTESRGRLCTLKTASRFRDQLETAEVGG
jgi:hypothetical protein